jgi:hypothetical protein
MASMTAGDWLGLLAGLVIAYFIAKAIREP